MKIAGFAALILTLLLAAPDARADFIYYPLSPQPSAYTQPYQEQSRVQVVQHAQLSPQPCECPGCARSATVQQPSPPLPSVTVYPLIDEADRTVYFGFNKDRLNKVEREKLNSLTTRLMSSHDVTSTKIVGYADRIGSASYNETLSRRRALKVQSYLIDRGLIKPSGIETIWVGKSEPSTHCPKYLPRAKLLACLQADRKVEVNVIYRSQPTPISRPLY